MSDYLIEMFEGEKEDKFMGMQTNKIFKLFQVILTFMNLFFPISNFAPAQTLNEIHKSNTIFIEAVGQSVGFFSLNYDHRVHPNFTFRVGLGVSLGYTVPISANFITGIETSHHFEVGVGLTYGRIISLLADEVDDIILVPTGVLGYRYQPKNGGFVFRGGFTPWVPIDKDTYIDRFTGETRTEYHFGFFPMVGISGGYCF
ncbi:MAG: hypothetical protein ABIL74_07620 [candidate division WOR-3 bacterium]